MEGRILSLVVEEGDRVNRGQVLATLDNSLIVAEINQAKAELAARDAEVKEAEGELGETEAQLRQAQAALAQAKTDADRLQGLYEEGALPKQAAESAATNAKTAQEEVKSLQQQLNTRRGAITANQQRVEAQGAIIKQIQERLTYFTVQAPLTGMVLSKTLEQGDLAQPGQEILTIGDLGTVQINIQVSDRDLSKFQVGQGVEVKLDAFKDQTFNGVVKRILPVADQVARLIPVEITIPNPAGTITSGLLARVSYQSQDRQTIKVPLTALAPNEPQGAQNQTTPQSDRGVIFVVEQEQPEILVTARPVTLGQPINDGIEIIAGLKPGEKYIAVTDQPLKSGQKVQRSFLSPN
ncbi:MAG: efflux RND transporter periplasmic adaptor subunit [Synechococcaceae cyanobacterium RL_1_2]|nr:efflux RND transporter periplasmic adaptor subunit [Synechococcaceae cyanobacterium RL_1_2]